MHDPDYDIRLDKSPLRGTLLGKYLYTQKPMYIRAFIFQVVAYGLLIGVGLAFVYQRLTGSDSTITFSKIAPIGIIFFMCIGISNFILKQWNAIAPYFVISAALIALVIWRL